MRCPKCGKTIPSDSKYCNYCSSELTTPPAQENTSNETPKKKSSLGVRLVVVLLAFLAGKYILAPMFVSDIKTDSTSTTGGSSTTTDDEKPANLVKPSTGTSSAAYEAVFADTRIVHFPSIYATDRSSYAKKVDNGTIICLDYGYENDTVKCQTQTTYIPVSGYSDEEKAELEQTARTQMAQYA